MSDQAQATASRALRFVLVFVLALTVMKVWMSPAPLIDTAQAQIPDAGTQRRELVDEMRRTNALLQQLSDTIQTQTFKVRVEGLDKVAAERPKAPTRPAADKP
jgi:hypothetical protein